MPSSARLIAGIPKRPAASGSLRSHGSSIWTTSAPAACRSRTSSVHGDGVGHRHLLVVAVVLVLACCDMVKGPGTVTLAARRCWRAGTPGRATPPGRRGGSGRRRAAPVSLLPARLDDHPGRLDVDPLERADEAVGVALAAHLAVRDDVDAGALHVADGVERGGVLRLPAAPPAAAPEVGHAHARHGLRQPSRSISESGCG